jgi:hypothetical protein
LSAQTRPHLRPCWPRSSLAECEQAVESTGRLTDSLTSRRGRADIESRSPLKSRFLPKVAYRKGR